MPDVRIGELPWDPGCKLLDHLKAAIKKRTWLEIRHARRISFVSLQEPANDEAMPPELEQALAPAARANCDRIKLYAMAATVCQQLRALVSRDVDATAIVKGWSDGFVEKDEVMKLTGARCASMPSTSQMTCSAGSRRRRSVAVPVAKRASSIQFGSNSEHQSLHQCAEHTRVAAIERPITILVGIGRPGQTIYHG